VVHPFEVAALGDRCQPGTWNATLGNGAELGLSDGCYDCPAGTYSTTEDAIACEVCPANTYQASTRSISCDPCPDGFWSWSGAVVCESIASSSSGEAVDSSTGTDVQTSTGTDTPTGGIRILLLISDSTYSIPSDVVAYKAQIIAALLLVHENADRFSVVSITLTVGSTTSLSVTVDILASSDPTEPSPEEIVILIQAAIADANHVIKQNSIGSLFLSVSVIGTVSTGSIFAGSAMATTSCSSLFTILAAAVVTALVSDRASTA